MSSARRQQKGLRAADTAGQKISRPRAVSCGATAVAVGGAVVTAASIGVVVGYVGAELMGAVLAQANFTAEVFVEYWASPDTVMP